MAPKKTALRLLNPALGHQTPSSAIELVRQAALCYYPPGPDWYAFLDSQVDSPIFTKNEETWQKALYQKQKVENAQDLIATAASYSSYFTSCKGKGSHTVALLTSTKYRRTA